MEKWASHYGGTKGFKNQWGLNMIQADMAYAHLTLSKGADVKPGAGVTIGFMDSGIDLYHPAFRNKNVREIFLDDFPNETINDDGASHGTGVASVAAGDRLSADSPYYNEAGQGVAWGADIVMFAKTLEGEGNHILPNSGDDKDDFYVPWTLDQISANDHWESRHFSDIKNEDIDILNRSIGSYGIIDMYTEEELRDNYGKTIRSWAQAGSEEKMIIVNSAGNDHGQPCRPEDHPANICTYDSELREYMVNAVSPGVIAGLVAYMEELQGHVISVIAVNPDDRLGWRFGGVEDSAGKITSFSNRCGIAADHCIAAPGSNLTVAYFGDGRRDYLRGYDYSLGFHKADDGSYIYGGYGTSYAAPIVSGGLAVMKQLFRSQLSNTQLVKRLFHTANKTGFYANRDIYGQGLMDLGAATNPWGILEFIRDNPTPCMTTTEGCLTQSEYNSDVASLASSYRSWGGQAYRNSSFLDRINADEAYAHLKLIQGISSPASLGKGVRIGFIYWAPTGQGKLYDLHDSIYDKNVTYDDEVSCNSSSCSYYPTMGLLSVALGERYSPSRGMFGVAPGANFYTRPFNSSDSRSDVISYINDLQTNADIIVIPSWSLGDKGAIVGLDNAEATQRINFSRNISDIFVSDVGDKANTLVEESDTGDVLLVMASRSDSLEDNCSGVESICISVPTESDGSIYAADNDHDTDYLYHFTNLSSGVVAGGLAVMKQQFRDQLSASELRDRLFRTSDKSGTYSNSSAYGHGLMDLGAATNPWGVLSLDTKSSAVGSGASIDSSFIQLGGPLGDGLTQSLGQQEIAAFDTLGAPFWFPAASFTVPSKGVSISTRLNHFLAPYQPRSLPSSWKLDFKPDAFAGEGGHLSLTNGASRFTIASPNGFAATAFHHPSDNDNQSPLTGLALSWTPVPLPDITIQAGVLDEQNSLLGSKANGAFGHLSGQTLFLSAGLNTTMPWGWQLAAQGELGVVNPSIGSSQFINDISSLSTSAFRLQASKALPHGGSFRLSLAQPLRVDRGTAGLSLPTGRTHEGIVLGQDVSASLVPTGRQLDLTAMVEFPLAEETYLSLGATRSQQPQHQQAAEAEWTFFTGWRAKL